MRRQDIERWLDEGLVADFRKQYQERLLAQ
jgi:hypothetical protein